MKKKIVVAVFVAVILCSCIILADNLSEGMDSLPKGFNKLKRSGKIRWLGCQDSDNGKNPNEFGAVAFTYLDKQSKEKNTYVINDVCKGDYVKERWCRKNMLKTNRIRCDDTCQEGRME